MRSNGFGAIAMPQADQEVLRLARSHASGKECVPSHLVLGSALRFFNSDEYKKDEIYMLFVPITTGPCRTGQYFVFFEYPEQFDALSFISELQKQKIYIKGPLTEHPFDRHLRITVGDSAQMEILS